MTLQEIEHGETEFLEFKRDFPSKDSKLMKTIAAFSNGKGGKIVFGVDDETHEIIGIENDKVFKFMDSLANMISETIYPQVTPRITFETLNDKTIIVAEILSGQNQPYFLKSEGSLDGVYIRVAATTRKAEREKIKELVLWGEGKSYDRLFENHEPANTAALKKLCSDIEKFSQKTPVQIENLIGWGLLRQEENRFIPSVAYRLLAENDLHFARIQCGLFKGTDKVFFIDRKEFDGSVYKQIENAYNFVLQHINMGAKIEGLYRKDIPEIPQEAIRELIVNAVMHRNYLAHSNIQVCIYDDRLEITNPGGLYGGLTIEKMLAGISSIRNELLADIFLKMRIVEKWGTGIKRVAELCKNHGLGEVKYTADEEFFTATIYRTKKDLFAKDVSSEISLGFPQNFPKTSLELHQNFTKNLSESVLKTFDELKKNPFATAEELAKILNISSRSVKAHFSVLKEKGLIEYTGSKKGGHWIIKAVDLTK
ncbi:MAG: putative DNA binding domain-containing protein [Treponema sp.]|nr:putative DNA binding domain-containing protein [Treponema sp.]